jgi:hypothetical protein
LCCKLLPVNEGLLVNGIDRPGSFHKPAGQRCKHQCAAGCRVYNKRQMPMSCRLWNCMWITGQLPRDLRRPDRVHYVVDVAPDYVTRQDETTGATMDIPVVQIWCDPGYPDAHRDPALRAWLNAERRCALIRFDSSNAILLVPPSVNADGTWYERPSNLMTRRAEHSPAEIFERTGARVEFIE